MALVVGVDEAGRGAVLGPLVVAGAVLPAARLPELAALNVRESKSVARARRAQLLRELWAFGVRGRAVVIPPERIDQENLTHLELWAIGELVRFFRPARVIGDAPVSPQAIPRFRHSLARSTGLAEDQIHLFPQADAREPLVAAASLLAKVVRDGHIRALHRVYGDFGWGYPGEAKVQEFLAHYVRTHGGLPSICRKRWSSVHKTFGLKLQGAS